MHPHLSASLCGAMDYPSYEKTSVAAVETQHVSQGFLYLAILGFALIIMVTIIARFNKKR